VEGWPSVGRSNAAAGVCVGDKGVPTKSPTGPPSVWAGVGGAGRSMAGRSTRRILGEFFGVFGDIFEDFSDFTFGDFGVSFVGTVAGRHTRRGEIRLSVRCEPLIVLTRGP